MINMLKAIGLIFNAPRAQGQQKEDIAAVRAATDALKIKKLLIHKVKKNFQG